MTNLDDELDGPWETATAVRNPEAQLHVKRSLLRTRLRELRDRGLSPLDREIQRQRRLYARQKAREGR